MSKIIIDPLTRISGFLQIKIIIDKNKIIDAQCSGELFRGFETMLEDRYPLDAIYFTERICGICSTAHSIASALCLENILNVKPTQNNKMLRDFLHGCEFVQNHLRHFYLYCLPDYLICSNISPLYPVKASDFRIPKDKAKIIAGHYIKSLTFSKMAHEMLAILGGKAPHNHGVFVGGVTVNINSYKIEQLKSILLSIKNFVKDCMLDDAYTISKYYNDYFKIGIGSKNLMSFGVFNSYEDKDLNYVYPGIILDNKLTNLNTNKISENTEYSWYKNNQPDIFKKDAYTFIKAPRYEGKPVQVGPIARMIISGNYPYNISTMDRIISRVLELYKILGIMEIILSKLECVPSAQSIYEIPDYAEGSSYIDTTRGSLTHFMKIQNKKINHYNIITPSNWNLSPKDSLGIHGAVESALMGTEIMDENNPIEIGRIVRSFDPCVSCATHVTTSDNITQDYQII